MDDYAYGGTKFRGDPYLPPNPSAQWTNAGKTSFSNFSCFINFLKCIWEFTYDNFLDVGLERPPIMSPILWWVAHPAEEDAAYDEGADPIVEMDRNLEPEYVTIDDVSLR